MVRCWSTCRLPGHAKSRHPAHTCSNNVGSMACCCADCTRPVRSEALHDKIQVTWLAAALHANNQSVHDQYSLMQAAAMMLWHRSLKLHLRMAHPASCSDCSNINMVAGVACCCCRSCTSHIIAQPQLSTHLHKCCRFTEGVFSSYVHAGAAITCLSHCLPALMSGSLRLPDLIARHCSSFCSHLGALHFEAEHQGLGALRLPTARAMPLWLGPAGKGT